MVFATFDMPLASTVSAQSPAAKSWRPSLCPSHLNFLALKPVPCQLTIELFWFLSLYADVI